jgi:iron-sulfur cluster insertion protein
MAGARGCLICGAPGVIFIKQGQHLEHAHTCFCHTAICPRGDLSKGIQDTMPDTAYATTGKFSLTDAAAVRISAMLEGEADGSFFRVAVNGGGCSGFQYEFSIDNVRSEDDLEFNSHGVGVVIDEMSLELVDQAELDFVQDLMGAYFAVSNPNATASCGCGTSFSV